MIQEPTASRSSFGTKYDHPDVYPFAAHLARQYGCTHILAIGADAEQLAALHPEFQIIGVSYDEELQTLRARYPFGHWLLANLETARSLAIDADIAARALIICSDVIQRLSNPAALVQALHALLADAPAAVLALPERDAWQLERALPNSGLRVTFSGLTVSDPEATTRATRLVVVQRDTLPELPVAPPEFRVVALMTGYNEVDIIEPSLRRLIAQGVGIYFLDNWSTDGTFELVQQLVGKGIVGLERFPQAGASQHFELDRLLARVEHVVRDIQADWFIHHDVDEIRESPWPSLNLRDALFYVQSLGFNAIDHTVIEFRPVDGGFQPGGDFGDYFRHFEFSQVPGHFTQIKAWRNLNRPVSLADTGGHEVRFTDRRVYPYKFLLRHYPIRSQAHGLTKVLRDRQPRWSPEERAAGWHAHYDEIGPQHNFIGDPAALTYFDPSDFYNRFLTERLTGVGISRLRPVAQSPGAGSPPAGYYDHPRPEVVRLVPTSAKRILELGCAGGALAASLKRRQACHVTGLEYVAEAARRATGRLDRVIQGDCETLDFNGVFEPEEFDCLIAADVLEHLRDPEAMLKRLKPFLKPDAAIVVSIPNVRNANVLRDAVEGNWTYQDAGILDRTHLRFFTRREIEKMCDRLGYAIEACDSVDDSAMREWERLGRPSSVQFGSMGVHDLPPHEMRELFVIQWLVRARQPVAIQAAADVKRGMSSIIVLTYNQLRYTRQCIDSVLRHTDPPYELILVDNGSTDGTPDYLRSIRGAKVVLNGENLGFAAGNNQGLALATGDNIVLLNNDAVVTDGWLTRMTDALQRDPSIGFVGPRSNQVSGPQLIARVPYATMNDMERFAAERAAHNAGLGSSATFVVGFCLLVRRAVIDKIGGLDTRFGSGNYEDNDFCLRAVLGGWTGWIADDAFVHHYGSRTFIGEGIDQRHFMRKNADLFVRKWDLTRDPQTGAPMYLDEFFGSRRFNPETDRCPLPSDVPFVDITPALGAYYEGVHLLQLGDGAAAIPALQAAVDSSPETADFHNALGAAFFEAERFGEAVAALSRAASLAPHDESIRANLEEARGRYPRAVSQPAHAHKGSTKRARSQRKKH
jgi:GT2 family glycosyltransferase/2-polyprenyl-3-methyl-5-hydroxy-6-metoxy-1,4-benzoquinol methylase